MTETVVCFALQLYFTLILCSLSVVSEMCSNRQHVTKTVDCLTL